MKKVLIMLLLAASAGAARAQAPDPDTTTRHFLIMASIGNLQEINAGKLAAQKASRADVKSFGQMMVTDHTRLEQELLQLARDRGYQLPAAATETPPQDIKLAAASGDDFDRMYIHAMVPGHGSTVLMFSNYALIGKDREVQEFARRTLPTLKEHLAAIKALDEQYKTLTAK